MKIITTIAIVFTVFALVFLIVYFVGSFISAEFSITKWDKDVRGVIGFISSIASVFTSSFCVAEYWDNLKKKQP